MTEYEEVSGRVVSEVADREGISEEELPLLYESIEPDALDELFYHTKKTRTELEVQFTYAGYTVLIRDSEEITLKNSHDVSNDLDT